MMIKRFGALTMAALVASLVLAGPASAQYWRRGWHGGGYGYNSGWNNGAWPAIAGLGLGLAGAAAASSYNYGYPGYYSGYPVYSSYGYGYPSYGYRSYGYRSYGYNYGYPYGGGIGTGLGTGLASILTAPFQVAGAAIAPLTTGRSVATGRAGDTCTTPVKACELRQVSFVGNGCSCRVAGGRARGTVTP